MLFGQCKGRGCRVIVDDKLFILCFFITVMWVSYIFDKRYPHVSNKYFIIYAIVNIIESAPVSIGMMAILNFLGF